MTMTDAPSTIVVVGGGVTGLSAARRAALDAGPGTRVVLLEAAERLGGRVTTIDVDGIAVDVGPEAIVTYQPGIMATCAELGLTSDLLEPACTETRVFARGALRPLPPKLMEGAPGGAWSVARTGVLSTRGMLRAGLDLVLPRTKVTDMSSIGALVQARMGREVADRLVDPLLGGVHAGSIWHLDAHLLAPQVTGALARRRSLVRGMRVVAAERRAASGAATGAAPASPFRTVRGGLRQLVTALESAALDAGVEIHRGAEVTRITRDGRVLLSDDSSYDADAVVLATPATSAAQLVARVAPASTSLMQQITWASTATCVLRVPAAGVAGLEGLSGVLVPRSEGEHIKAITCVSTKWGHEPVDGDVLLKCYLGHAQDDEPVTDLDDAEIVERTTQSLARVAGLSAAPTWSHVTRFVSAIPQYAPGHAGRVTSIEQHLESTYEGRVQLAGASWHGSGIGSCIASGARAGAAAAVHAHELTSITTTSPGG